MLRPIDRRTWSIWLAGFLVLALSACTGFAGPGASSTPGPQPTTGEPLSAAELRLLLITELGPLWYCDRDEYPVGRDELESMREQWAQLVADVDLAETIRAELGLPPLDGNLTDGQRLEAYRLWKMATAVQLVDVGNGRYRFDYLARPAAGAADGTRTAGTIDTRGAISVEQQAAAGEPMCPICLSIGTSIEGPAGDIAVDRLRIGDVVWTLDLAGRRVAGTVIALGSTTAPPDHVVLEVTLADGRAVSASPGHPLADGRSLSELRVGDDVDGSSVASVEPRAYGAARTYDLVVSGETGTYFAGGIALGSTLAGAGLDGAGLP